MRYRYVPQLGREASVIIMGSYLGTADSDEKLFELMDEYLAIGGNWIDTARVYGKTLGSTESILGRWLRERKCRDKIILGTKGGHPPLSDMHEGRLDRANLASDLEESLEALGCDGVDVYYLHRDDVSRPVGDILETLNGFVQAGKVRVLGASNWTAQRIAEANAYAQAHGMKGFEANQPMWSLAKCVNLWDDTLVQMEDDSIRLHADTGMLCTPYSSQGKGYFMKLESGTLSEKVRGRYDGPENRAVFDRLCELSRHMGHSVSALQLAWLINQPFPVFPIVGASSAAQVRAFAEAADTVLSGEQVDFLRG